ncbi:MAG: leucine-rich repeat domain-containing protein [Candidatus Heimdallarchaeota archaeon]|nr:leucine-rich repeat domain-containing protein [Candidatus Heimdallarchaeota archaeon]
MNFWCRANVWTIGTVRKVNETATKLFKRDKRAHAVILLNHVLFEGVDVMSLNAEIIHRDFEGDFIKRQYENYQNGNFDLVAIQLFRLDHFPDALTMLPSLSWLNLDNNQIVTVSDNVDKLVNLWHLYLSDNSIKYLPESMHQLKNLRSMTLSENDIKNCDMILKILQCTNISSLTWYGNPSRECVTAIHGIVDNLSEEEMIQRSVFSVKFTFDHSNLQLNCKH